MTKSIVCTLMLGYRFERALNNYLIDSEEVRHKVEESALYIECYISAFGFKVRPLCSMCFLWADVKSLSNFVLISFF